VARIKGRLRCRQPKLLPRSRPSCAACNASGDFSVTNLVEPFTVSRPTMYRTPAQPALAGTVT
jgi:hypothetical protein